MKKLATLFIFLCLSACAPKSEIKTVYVDKVKYVMPELPKVMTDPVLPAKNPSIDPTVMTHNDLLKWWSCLRYNLQEANQKLIKIRIWHNKHHDMIINEKLER